MNYKTIRHEALNEEYHYAKHPTGYDIFVMPKPGYSKTYAMFATKYGSVDNTFKAMGSDEYITVPAGIAHFLEHKLFENEKENAFARYAKTGASANAYTSFDKTAYLFSCTDQFEDSFEILLDFVQSPYFTPETVKKEQGIIGQEIRMCDDNPDWRVFFNLLGALYERHTVRIDIAGTVESISDITAELLYKCYEHFYNPDNMAVIVCGPVSFERVLRVADKALKPKKNVRVERSYPDEPKAPRNGFARQAMSVAIPLFNLGIKDTGFPADGHDVLRRQANTEILLQYIAGAGSPLYKKLYDEGLINPSFSIETMYSGSYGVTMLGGESKDPERVGGLFWDEVSRIKKEGIDQKVFTRCKKALYGKQAARFDSVESIANALLSAHFLGAGLFDILEAYGGVTLQDAALRLESHFIKEHSALSVIEPVTA